MVVYQAKPKAQVIQSWAQALELNRAINTSDNLRRVGGPRHKPAYEFTPADPAQGLDREILIFAQSFIDFIKTQQRKRQEPETQAGFAQVAALRHEDSEYFCLPRHFGPEYLFADNDQNKSHFAEKKGLDVGCCTFVPPNFHWQYYEVFFGSEMRGIDINYPAHLHDNKIGLGDVRNLQFEDAAFDFATVAMIFGYGRPSDTILEIAAGLSELKRTVKGFAYLADRTLMPEVVFVAQQLGFDCYYVRHTWDQWGSAQAFPVGTYLVVADGGSNPFSALIDQLKMSGPLIPPQALDREFVLPVRKLMVSEPAVAAVG